MFASHLRPCSLLGRNAPFSSSCNVSHTMTLSSSTPVRASSRQQRVQPCRANSKDTETLALEGVSAASADEFSPPAAGGITIGEVVLLAAPILLYGIFSVYRAKVDPRAKLSDFLFITAAVVIVANILSILVFKIRIF